MNEKIAAAMLEQLLQHIHENRITRLCDLTHEMESTLRARMNSQLYAEVSRAVH